MVRKPVTVGPRLEALLDQRDHLRIKISLAEEDDTDVGELRRLLFELDRAILKHWETPES